MMAATVVAGLDGCRGGWVMVTAPVDGEGKSAVERVSDVRDVFSALDSGQLAAAGIDMPIGLPDTEPRRCDVEARAMIGARRSSVFPAPLRGLLGATEYGDALERCRALSGKGLSRQAFGILSKVGEVDRYMTPRRQRLIVEVHPEVSFTVLSGYPMASSKKTPAGRAERLDALRRVFPDIDRHASNRITGIAPDDIVDAFAVAWSARRWWARTHIRLGGDPDVRGLRMEIIA
jgi:predicted RNase H-like nuclease